jgi:adenylate cyclase
LKKLFSLFFLFLSLSSFSNSADSLKTDLKSLLQNPPKGYADTILAKKYLDVVTFYFEDLNLDSAKKYLDSGFNYANKSKSNFLVNEFNLFYNTYYLYNSNLDTAITIASSVFENKPNLIAKATALSGIGNGYYFKGDYLNALEYYLQGLEIEEQITPEKTNITYSNIANLYSNLGDAEKAIEYFRKCQTIEKANKDTLGLFVGFINFHNTFS